MKKRKRSISAAVVLLLSINFMAACAPAGATPIELQTAAAAVLNKQGPMDSVEVNAYADKLFAEKMKKFIVNGSSFVVVKDGKVILNKGYGYADKEKKIPVDSDTVFQIASVTKTFTALAAMQLVEQGKIRLDQDIQSYLGGLKIPNKTGKPLTMFNLLTYTSGVDLPDITTFIGPELVDQDIPMGPFLAKHMPTVVRTPGEAYTYDNFGFLLAGYAIQQVSGIPFDQYMAKHVFQPLGMHSSSSRFTPELLSRMAAHYDVQGKRHETFGHAPTDGPQGSILSTANDMSKYLIMHLQKGKYEGKEIISKKSAAQMHTYQVFADKAGKSIPMTTVGGFEGYFNDMANGQHVILKGGSMPGHQSLIVLLPNQNTGFYMSYNNDSMMSMEIYEAFMDHYYPEVEKPAPITVPLEQREAKKYEGIYQNTRMLFLKSKFSYANGKLLMETNTTGKHTLRMIHPLLFVDETGQKLAFKKDSNGDIKYYYYANSKGMDFGADAQKVNMKKPFTDVPANSKYKSYIDHLHAMDIMSAKSDNQFDPGGTMTQGEFADILLRAHGWYGQVYSIEGNKQKIVTGIPGFDRDKLVTRQAAAVMVQNLKQAPPAAKIRVSDAVDAWATDAIRALVSQGIVDPDTTVKSDGSVHYRAKQLLLRQEASALLDKAFGYYTLPLPLNMK